MANKPIYVDVVEEPPYFDIFFRIKDYKGAPLAGAKCELYAGAAAPTVPMITAVITEEDGIAIIYDIPEGKYGWRVIFPSGKSKTDEVTAA